MKKNHRSIKSISLNLQKETVAVLSNHQLDVVQGGALPQTRASGCTGRPACA